MGFLQHGVRHLKQGVDDTSGEMWCVATCFVNSWECFNTNTSIDIKSCFLGYNCASKMLKSARYFKVLKYVSLLFSCGSKLTAVCYQQMGQYHSNTHYYTHYIEYHTLNAKTNLYTNIGSVKVKVLHNFWHQLVSKSAKD